MEGQVEIKKNSSNDVSIEASEDNYPYGTSLSFDDDLVDELKVDKLKVGDVVEVRGYAFIESKSEHDSKENSGKSVRLQMTSIKITQVTDDVATQLYGE